VPADIARAAAVQSRETWPTVSQAGRILGCGPQRVRELIAQGRLISVRGPLNFHLVDPQSITKLQRERMLAAAQKRLRPTGAGRADK
jgi:hypothetical protein